VSLAVGFHLVSRSRKTRVTREKIDKAREYGFHEPVSIHPSVDPAICIGSGACIRACPEKDILGLVDSRATTVNASRCVGHGACAAACPVGAITLVFGTETRGVEIPYVTPKYETNIKGVYIVGELGGMGLIRNAVVQGRLAVETIAGHPERGSGEVLDLIVIGCGPAGLSASLTALKHRLRFRAIDQSDIGGSVLHYPRHKIVMTAPVDLPLYGKVRLKETSKEALLDLWTNVINKTGLEVHTREKMADMAPENGHFKITTTRGEFRSRNVVLAIGRRGTPRKLGVPGEDLPKVAYRLLEPEQHRDQDLLVVGGGDSAVEAAVALADQPGNRVSLSYRGEAFSRIKPENHRRLAEKVDRQAVRLLLKSNVKEISASEAAMTEGDSLRRVANDYVYIFAGGEAPNAFLQKIGVRIEKKFGKA
jgi:thioredoxin reductase (NADPH)